MEFFKKYSSNTLAGSGNQSYFVTEDEAKVYKSRTYYKIFAGGEYNYSILFSNITDGTFADGIHSHSNLILDPWTITEASVGVVRCCSMTEAEEPCVMQTLTFEGKSEKQVAPGEFFASDPIGLSADSGEYLCLEISFKGRRIPYHEESIIPSFVWEDEEWRPNKKHPFASMIGCDREVKQRISFLGDSITQGIGVKGNSYAHWNAVLADRIGKENAYWNLGLGYGRAADAATDGAWLYKAKKNDIVFLCYGVNDINRGYTADEIKKNLEAVLDMLNYDGVKVVIQSVPPFNYSGERIDVWQEVNGYIRTTLAQKAELFFDCAEILKKSDAEPYIAPFGGHPNKEGCALWGEALATSFSKYLGK